MARQLKQRRRNISKVRALERQSLATNFLMLPHTTSNRPEFPWSDYLTDSECTDPEDFFITRTSLSLPDLNPIPDLRMHTVTMSGPSVWDYGGMVSPGVGNSDFNTGQEGTFEAFPDLTLGCTTELWQREDQANLDLSLLSPTQGVTAPGIGAGPTQTLPASGTSNPFSSENVQDPLGVTGFM